MDESVAPSMGSVETLQDVGTRLQQHEDNSVARAARIEKKIKHLKEEMKMSTPDVNVFGSGLGSVLPMVMGNAGGNTAGAIGGGLGAGVLGGVLGGALLGRRGGILGGDGDGAVGGVVTPSLLASTAAQITDTAQNTVVLQALGDIKAAVPLAESQVQLALAGVDNNLTLIANTNATASALANSLTNQNIAMSTASINKGVSEAIAASLASQGSIKESIAAYGVANLNATKDSQYAITTAVRDDGDKTRALIVSQNDANLQRMLAVAEAQLAETRAAGRSREVEVNVAQTVNQNQNQIQAQTQQQQQFQILAQLAAQVGNLANDIQVVRQTQSNINFGVQGTAGQTASAANTRVN